jgi:biopolymer transport protein ExbB
MSRSHILTAKSWKRTALLLGSVTLFAFASAGTLSAQAPAAEAAPAAETKPAAPKKSFLTKYYLDGGFWMHPILLLSMASFGLTIYHLMLLRRDKFSPPALVTVLRDHMQACRVRSAIEVAASNPSLLGRMMASALTKVDATNGEDLGREKVEDVMADQIIAETKNVAKTLSIFTVIISVAPMMGLFGTVVGMVEAFAQMVENPSAGAPELAGAISTALLTTMGGLLVAIPSIMIYFFLRTKFNGLINQAQADGTELMVTALNSVQGENQFAKIPEGMHAA